MPGVDGKFPAMRILVIEDEPKLADYLKKGLSEQSHVVDLARDGVDGLHLALEGVYDLIVLDVMLPGVDGFGVLAAVRQSAGCNSAPSRAR